MKIAVNTRLLLPNGLEGIGRFAFETLKILTNKHPEITFYYLFDRPYDRQFITSENIIPVVIPPPARHPILFNIWFDYSVARWLKKNKPDVFLSPDGYLSLRTKTPQLAVIHDLNFEHFPKDLPGHITRYYQKRFPKFAQKAKRIATVSNFSKQDLIKQYQIDESKIDVVYNGVNDGFKIIADAEKLKIKASLTNGKDYFIYVGALHKRKNINRLVKAFDLFKQKSKSSKKLVIVGKALWAESENQFFNSINCKDDVIFTGRISDDQLYKYTAVAHALCYVSYFEGFGIPIAEAMRCGVPVICSNVTSMPEVAGDGALLVDPFDEMAIANAMMALEDEKLRSQLASKALKQSERFSWDKTAEALWESVLKTIEI